MCRVIFLIFITQVPTLHASCFTIYTCDILFKVDTHLNLIVKLNKDNNKTIQRMQAYKKNLRVYSQKPARTVNYLEKQKT